MANATANFQAVDQFGNVTDFLNVALSGNGNNFFNLQASNGEIAVSFSLLSTNLPQSISRLQQVRLGAVQIPQAVPEPGSLGLPRSRAAGSRRPRASSQVQSLIFPPSDEGPLTRALFFCISDSPPTGRVARADLR